MSNPSQLVSELWNYCSIPRDYGLSYGDYVELQTFLPFLKKSDEHARAPFRNAGPKVEQTRNAVKVERRRRVVEAFEVLVSANLQRATRLRQAILQKAFSGEL
jgi:hypothetical protein